MRSITFLALMAAIVLTAACNGEPNDHHLTETDCTNLVYQIYDECSLSMPMYQGAYPSADQATSYCVDDKAYDWHCADECVFHNKGLCMSIKLCLENCR